MPEISVIMPIYNTNPTHLKCAIESILSQTFSDFEFLILNDSPKNLELDRVLSEFKDKRIKYMKSEHNLGIAEAHNKLVKLAKGKYIAIMDHDDISLPTRLEKQYTFMENHPEVGICSTAYRRFGKLLKVKTIRHPQDHETIKASLLFYCPIHHPSAIMRKDILNKFKIVYDKRFISLNDRRLYLEIAKHAQLRNLPNVLYKYRMHPMMTSKVRRNEIMNEQLQYREALLSRYAPKLTKNDRNILHAYVFNGRCHITSIDTLKAILRVLKKLVQENRRTHYADDQALKEVCGKYLIRRCKNAALKGHISSQAVLKNPPFPVRCPLWLKLFNYFMEKMKKPVQPTPVKLPKKRKTKKARR